MQVKGLEFNSFSPNLLATGAADGDLCIWDVAKPSTPSLYPALKVRAKQKAGVSLAVWEASSAEQANVLQPQGITGFSL